MEEIISKQTEIREKNVMLGDPRNSVAQQNKIKQESSIYE